MGMKCAKTLLDSGKPKCVLVAAVGDRWMHGLFR
jgi:hypothetical protein